MIIFDKMKDLFKTKAVEEQTAKSPLGDFTSLLRGQTIARREVNATEVAFVFACIEKRAKLTSRNDLVVYKKDADGRLEVDDKHPINQLLASPNRVFDQSIKEIIYLVQTRLDFFGNAYIWARPSTNGKSIVDLIPIMTNEVKIIANREKYNAIYEFKISGATHRIPGDEVIHFKTVGIPKDNSFLNNHVNGTPKILNSIKVVMSAHKEMMEYVESYFENDTIPPMVFSTEDNLTDDNFQRLKQTFNSMFGSSKKKPKLLLAEGRGKFEPMDVGKNTLNPSVFKEGLDNNIIQQICTAFETPKALLTNEFKFSDRNQYLQTYKQDVIKPLFDYIAGTFERHFRTYYPDIILSSDSFNFIDENTKLEYLKLLISGGAVTKNELREAAGYDPIEESELEPEPPTGEQKKSLDLTASENEILKYWKKYDDASEGFADSFKKELNKFYDDLQKHINENITKISNKSIIKAGIDDNSNLIDIDKFVKILQGLVSKEMQPYLREMLEIALNDIDIDADDFTLGEAFIREVTDEINELMKEPVNSVDKEIKKEIKKIIQDNPLDTESARAEKITAAIGNRFSEIYKKSRTEMIARTTATGGSESMKDKVFKKTGFDKVWISSRDGKVRPSHNSADKTLADANGKFTVAGNQCSYPADPSLPAAESINCRCRMAAKKKDKIFINGKQYDYKL